MRYVTHWWAASLLWVRIVAWGGDTAAMPAESAPALPQDTMVNQLEPMAVKSKPWLFNQQTRYAHLLPEVNGTQITVTRKNTVIHLDDQPTVIDANPRTLYARMPGLLIAEQQSPGQLNINYRGIGGSGALGTQESELLLVLQDGVPTASDWIGFPTQYYFPPPQSIASIQLIRGGAALLYGPGAGPVLNYVSRLPDRAQPIAGYSENVFGTDAFFSTFNTLSETRGHWDYRANVDYRRSDGERNNGQYGVKGGDLHFGYQLTPAQYLGLDLHAYEADDGEAGRMSDSQFTADPFQTTTPYDHDWVQRYTALVQYRAAPDPHWLIESKLWGGYHDQAERNANGPTTVGLVDQAFRFAGLDTRARLRWGRGNAATAGFVLYGSDDPRLQYTTTNLGASGNDHSGTETLDQNRYTRYGAFFAENVFRFGRFHVVPSVRLEHEILDIDEPLPPGGVGSRYTVNRSFGRTVPLFGIGLGNDFGRGNETYFNVSQGYRPLRYLDVAPTRTGTLPDGNSPDPSTSLTYEAGVHGWPLLGLYYDASLYAAYYWNRIESQSVGAGGDVINVNTGDTRHRGLEVETDYDLLRLEPSAFGGPAAAHLNLFFNGNALDAEFVKSISPAIPVGNTPGYAPKYILRGGLEWIKQRAYKVGLSVLSVGWQYVQDSDRPLAGSNAPATIPAYTVVDLGVDYWLRPHFRLIGSVSNLTDRKYYSRVLFGGLEPADGRHLYLGLSVEI